MRLYSLRQSNIFRNAEKVSSRDRQNMKQKLQAILLNQAVIQVMIDCSKHFYLRISDRQRQRQILIMVNSFSITKMFIFADHLVLILQDKLIRYIKIEELFEQYLYYDRRKIIFDEKKLKKADDKLFINKIQDVSFNRMSNYMYTLEIIKNTVTIAKFNQNISLGKIGKFELSQSKNIQKITFIPHLYQEGDYDDAHFGIQMTVNPEHSCFYFLEVSKDLQITFSKIYTHKQAQLALKISRINKDSYVLYHKNRLAFLKREGETHKWFLQFQIYSRGQIISELKFQNTILTLEKINNFYFFFQYGIDKIVNMQQISPYLIQIFHKPKNLSLIENNAGINILFVGSRPFLIEKCIFNIFYTLRDIRTDHIKQYYQNLSKSDKQDILAYQIIKEYPIKQRKWNLINQLSQYNVIQQRINQLLTILKKLHCKQNRSILHYFSYEYFTIFLYGYHFLRKQQALYTFDKPYIPSNLNFLISSVIGQCSKFYEFFRKNQKFTKLIKLCKIVYSIAIFCIESLKSANSILQAISIISSNFTPSVIPLLYNPTLCLQHSIFELRNAFVTKDIGHYIKIKHFLSKLIQLSDDYQPLVYLLVDRPYSYTLNNHHLLQIQMKRKQQAEQDSSIIDFLKGCSLAVENYKRYNCMQNIQQFSSLKNSGNLLCIRNFYFLSHSKKAQQLKQSNSVHIKPYKTSDKLKRCNVQFDAPNEQILEISLQEIIKMKIEMNQKIPLQLIGEQMNSYYHFCACLQLESIKIKKSIKFSIEEILFVRRHNEKRKYGKKYLPNEDYIPVFESNRINLSINSYKNDRMLIQFQNLLDPFLKSFVIKIATICEQFHLESLSNFYSQYLQNDQINKLSQFLRHNNYNRSEIKRIQNNYVETDIILSKGENQQLFIDKLEQNIMNLYLFITQIKQNKFQISEHIRSNCFAQMLREINKIKQSYQNRHIFKLQTQNNQFLKLINVKDISKKIKKMNDLLYLTLNSPEFQFQIPRIHKQLINLCLLLKISWIGDPFYLFMQITSQPSKQISSKGFFDKLCYLLCSSTTRS